MFTKAAILNLEAQFIQMFLLHAHHSVRDITPPRIWITCLQRGRVLASNVIQDICITKLPYHESSLNELVLVLVPCLQMMTS